MINIVICDDTNEIALSMKSMLENVLLIFLLLFTFGIIYSLIIKFIKNKKANIMVKKTKYLFFMFQPSANLILIIFTMMLLIRIPQNVFADTYTSLTILLLLIFAINIILDIITYFVIEKIEKLERNNIQYEKQLMQTKLDYQEAILVDKSKSELRKVRHDLNNILLTTKALISAGKIDEAIETINKTTNDLSTIDGIPISSNNTLNALLSLKKQQADGKNIDLDININETEPLLIDSYDLCRILANLIDNAGEAVLETNQKIIKLSINIDDGQVLIKVTNAYDEKHFRKTSNRVNRGNGKIIINNIIKKYKGSYKASANDNKYQTDIIIPNINNQLN